MNIKQATPINISMGMSRKVNKRRLAMKSSSNPELLDKVKAYAQSLKEGVQKKDAKLQEVGFRNYSK